MDEKSEDDGDQEAYSLSETEGTGCGEAIDLSCVYYVLSLATGSFPISINTLCKKQPVWGYLN